MFIFDASTLILIAKTEILDPFLRDVGLDAVRDMVTRGRVLFAMERYKKGEASLGRAAELAGIPVGQMMTLLTEFVGAEQDRG